MQIAVLLEAILNRLPGSTPTTKLDSKKVKFGDEATPGQGKKFPVAPLTKEQIVKIKSALARARSQGLKGTRITSPNAPLRTHHDPPKR